MNRRKFLQSLVLIPLASYIKLEASSVIDNASKNDAASRVIKGANEAQASRVAKNKPSRSIDIGDVAREETSIKRIKIETVPIAGFQHYQGKSLWHELKINDNLSLVRELENKFDENAIIIKWKGEQLGYIPRLDNQAIALLMDEGSNLDAKIVKLSKSKNPWNRVEVSLYQIV